MCYAGLPRILFNGDHTYSRINDYTEQPVYISARAVIVATIRISVDFTVLHLTSNHKE